MAQSSTALPALPSLTANPTFFPTASPTSTQPPHSAPSTKAYYPPAPTSATDYQPLALTSPAKSTAGAPRRDTASAGPSRQNGIGNGYGYGLSVSQRQASQAASEWEVAFERQEEERWSSKVRQDLTGWRGGHGVARSTYSRTALPGPSYFGQPKTGIIGRHLPKEIVRIERDWSEGEVCQFESSFPMELEGRISPVAFQALIDTLNTHFAAAYSIRGAVLDNLLAIATWWTSLLWRTSTFERELLKVEAEIQRVNQETFNPAGLHVLSPRDVALQFLEIEYY